MLCAATYNVSLLLSVIVSVSLYLSPCSGLDLCELLQREGSHQSAGLLCSGKASGAWTHHYHRFRQDWPRYLCLHTHGTVCAMLHETGSG